ncbi:MAG: hypothetical protein R3E08_06925 [Thiotrichaceae bacterium]
MMLIRHLIASLFLVILLCTPALALAESESCNVTSAQAAQAVVKMVAEQGARIISINTNSLQSNYEQLPPNTIELAEDLRLGTPIREYHLSPSNLENYARQHQFDSILVSSDLGSSWYIPVFVVSKNFIYAVRVYCWQGIFTINYIYAIIHEEIAKVVVAGVNLTQAKLVNTRFESIGGTYFIEVTEGEESISYPASSPGEYSNMKPVNNLGGYKTSDVITKMLLAHLTLMNRRGNITVYPDLKIHVPYAEFYYLALQNFPESLNVTFTFIPNPENRLLFEGSYTYPVD